jgi:L-ascorbate metabolism protein UlaG (beta-lactamase superfamily)
MKITKFVHSCLLAETPDRVVLIDPGVYSWESGLFKLNQIERIDRIAITHEHSDHFHIPFIEEVVNKFPDVNIVASGSVTEQLKKAGVLATFRGTTTNCLKPFEAIHEAIPSGSFPDNIGFHFKDQLTHPGDSFSFNESKEILALPYTAPWGSVTDAVNLAIKLKPKFIIPIHDWYVSKEGKKWLYKIMSDIFVKHGINFVDIKDGQTVTL